MMLYVNPQLSATRGDFLRSNGFEKREAQALQEYERLFIFQMLKEMRKTIPDSGLLGDGMKRSYFEEMMDDVMSGEMAASGQLGIAKQMATEIHAKELNIARASIAPLSTVPTAGIRVRGESAGIAVPDNAPRAYRLNRTPSEAAVGIPWARAHEGYRLNQ